MKQMNTVKTVVYGTIHMDSDRDKGYIKYSSFFSKRGEETVSVYLKKYIIIDKIFVEKKLSSG